MEYLEHIAMARSYGVLKSGRDKIDACLRNQGVKQITLPKWTTVGDIILALSHQSQQGMKQVRMKPLWRKGKLNSKRIIR